MFGELRELLYFCTRKLQLVTKMTKFNAYFYFYYYFTSNCEAGSRM